MLELLCFGYKNKFSRYWLWKVWTRDLHFLNRVIEAYFVMMVSCGLIGKAHLNMVSLKEIDLIPVLKYVLFSSNSLPLGQLTFIVKKNKWVYSNMDPV